MREVINNWEEIIKQQQQSGKSIPKYCNDIGIHPNTFYKHRKRFVGNVKAGEAPVVEIRPAAISAAAPIVLHTKKYTISLSAGFDEVQLKLVLKVVGELE